MSGRGGGGRGGRGGWRGGRSGGRGGPPGMPVAKDDDGNIIDTQPAGPPPLFPEMLLPEHPDVTPKDELILMRRNDLATALKRSPFVLEVAQEVKGDMDQAFERYAEVGSAVGISGPSQGSGAAAGGKPAAGGQAAGGKGGPVKAGAIKKKLMLRRREPLTSVIKLLPEYFPDELYSSSDRRFARLQDSYWKRAAKGKDEGGLARLEQLAQLEEKGAAEGGKGLGDGDDAPEAEEEVVDTDDEEEMDDDDYYKGAHFDDDEGYEDGFDDGGDDGPVY